MIHRDVATMTDLTDEEESLKEKPQDKVYFYYGSWSESYLGKYWLLQLGRS